MKKTAAVILSILLATGQSFVYAEEISETDEEPTEETNESPVEETEIENDTTTEVPDEQTEVFENELLLDGEEYSVSQIEATPRSNDVTISGYTNAPENREYVILITNDVSRLAERGGEISEQDAEGMILEYQVPEYDPVVGLNHILLTNAPRYVEGGLNPSTKYFYQFFYPHWNGSWENPGDSYTAISDICEFTTLAGKETTSLSVENFRVTDSGFFAGIAKFEVSNPEDEHLSIANVNLISDGGQNWCSETSSGSYSCEFSITDNTIEVYAEITAVVGVDSSEIVKITSEPIEVQKKDISELSVHLVTDITTSSFGLGFQLDPEYEADRNLSGYTPYCRKKGSGDDWTTSEQGLSADTEYEVYLVITAGRTGVLDTPELGTADHPLILKTLPDTEVDPELFDEGLWEYLLLCYSVDGKLTERSLENVTSLEFGDEYASAPIRTLKGIDRLRYLSRLTISGIELEDISQILNCATLRRLELINTGLTDIPDLSGTNIRTLNLNQNYLTEETLTEDKLPEAVRNRAGWLERTLLAQNKILQPQFSNVYYRNGSNYPFIMVPVKGSAQKEHTYTMQAEINDHTYTVVQSDTAEPEFIIRNVEGITENRSYTAKVVVTDETGREHYKNENLTVRFEELPAYMDEECSVPSGTRIHAEGITLPGELEDTSLIREITLLNDAHETVARNTGEITCTIEDNSNVYRSAFGENTSSFTYHVSVLTTDLTSEKPLKPGRYQILVKTDNRYYLIPNAVTVTRHRGDVNGDGQINVSDIIVIRDIILEVPNTMSSITEEDLLAADVNQDNKINVSDIILVRDRILEIVDDDYQPKN